MVDRFNSDQYMPNPPQGYPRACFSETGHLTTAYSWIFRLENSTRMRQSGFDSQLSWLRASRSARIYRMCSVVLIHFSRLAEDVKNNVRDIPRS